MKVYLLFFFATAAASHVAASSWNHEIVSTTRHFEYPQSEKKLVIPPGFEKQVPGDIWAEKIRYNRPVNDRLDKDGREVILPYQFLVCTDTIDQLEVAEVQRLLLFNHLLAPSIQKLPDNRILEANPRRPFRNVKNYYTPFFSSNVESDIFFSNSVLCFERNSKIEFWRLKQGLTGQYVTDYKHESTHDLHYDFSIDPHIEHCHYSFSNGYFLFFRPAAVDEYLGSVELYKYDSINKKLDQWYVFNIKKEVVDYSHYGKHYPKMHLDRNGHLLQMRFKTMPLRIEVDMLHDNFYSAGEHDESWCETYVLYKKGTGIPVKIVFFLEGVFECIQIQIYKCVKFLKTLASFMLMVIEEETLPRHLKWGIALSVPFYFANLLLLALILLK
ncbi:hypothetical protein IPH25_04890 [bacterium]|nr:MAG: hypothetical protein IPG37_01895 [bacterium]QQR61775.1 MAG: hypothetical protein IPH25_04890 [bacterium]